MPTKYWDLNPYESEDKPIIYYYLFSGFEFPWGYLQDMVMGFWILENLFT